MRPRLLIATASLLFACGTSTPTDDVFYVRSGGVDMPVWVRGDASSKTVILHIAGGPGGPSMYYADSAAFQRLTEKRLVAFWDQRGFGGSSGNAAAESLTLDQYVTDLSAVLSVIEQRYDHPRMILLGHSWGGLLGTAFLSDPSRQARVSAWIDVDGVHNEIKAVALTREWVVSQAQQRVDDGKDVEHWQAELAWYQSHPNLQCSDLVRHGTNINALDSAHVASAGLGSTWLNLSTPFDGMATLVNMSFIASQADQDGTPLCKALFTDLPDALPEITIPSLVVWGRDDLGIPLAMGQEAHAKLGAPEAYKSLAVLEDAGHDCPTDAPQAFADAVEGFLSTALAR